MSVPRLVPLTTAVPVILVALAWAGCLSQLQDGSDPASSSSACELFGHPDQVPIDAPTGGGPGDRLVAVDVLGPGGSPLGSAAVVAWWQPAPDRIEAVRLRTSDSGSLALGVPVDQDVEVIAGLTEWTHEGHVAAGPASVAADITSMVLTASSVLGSVEGSWDSVVAEGVTGAEWQPSALPWADEDHMARLERLDLALAWTNGPEGGADFGIAVGPGSGSEFHYTNREYQTGVGAQTEERTLEAADLADLGWDASTRPQAGPSVSTGAFAVISIPYTLTWEATFAVDPSLPDRCQDYAGFDAVDVTDSDSGQETATGSIGSTSATSTVTARPAGERRLG